MSLIIGCIVDNKGSGLRGKDDMYRDLLLKFPELPKVCAKVWGGSSSVFLWGHEVFHKRGVVTADTPHAFKTPFHQDTVLVPTKGRHMANLWIPLQDTPKENSLEIVRGSHKGPGYQAADLTADARINVHDKDKKSEFPVLPEIDSDRGAWPIVSWEAKLGDVIMLHPSCIHGGGKLSADFQQRDTLILRFFGDECDMPAYVARRRVLGPTHPITDEHRLQNKNARL